MEIYGEWEVFRVYEINQLKTFYDSENGREATVHMPVRQEGPKVKFND